MPGLLGIIGDGNGDRRRFAQAAETLNFLGRSPVELHKEAGVSYAVSPLPEAPFAGPFYHNDQRICGAFAGDIFGGEEVPWSQISTADLGPDPHDWLGELEGRFTVAVYRKESRRFELYADHFACQPVFHALHGKTLVFSTQLAAFVRLGIGGDFDPEWFHRFLYYGYWVGNHTFLSGVRRLEPGNVLIFDVDRCRLEVKPYEERLRSLNPPLKGAAAIDHALEVFREQVPPMFGDGNHVEFALSGGLDSRTLYAFMPEKTPHSAFTYGMAGCHDQVEAALTARRLGIPHRQLFFDEAYVENLSRLIHETVWLSGGLAWINRCMLPPVYRFVAEGHSRPPILSSGIALDTLFRGHNNASGDVDALLRTGKASFSDPVYRELFEDKQYTRFRDTVTASADDLTAQHGPLSHPESYLSYTAYTLCPSYFSADLEIGGHYAALRVPGYDSRIVKLAYELEYSTIYLSKFQKHDLFKEYILQANLMASHNRLAQVPLQGFPLDIFLKQAKLRYHLYRTLNHGWRYVKRRLNPSRRPINIEDWGKWFGTVLAKDIHTILGPESNVRELVKSDTLDTYLTQNRWPWLARLASVELILQLMDNGWKSWDR